MAMAAGRLQRRRCDNVVDVVKLAATGNRPILTGPWPARLVCRCRLERVAARWHCVSRAFDDSSDGLVLARSWPRLAPSVKWLK